MRKHRIEMDHLRLMWPRGHDRPQCSDTVSMTKRKSSSDIGDFGIGCRTLQRVFEQGMDSRHAFDHQHFGTETGKDESIAPQTRRRIHYLRDDALAEAAGASNQLTASATEATPMCYRARNEISAHGVTIARLIASDFQPSPGGLQHKPVGRRQGCPRQAIAVGKPIQRLADNGNATSLVHTAQTKSATPSNRR